MNEPVGGKVNIGKSGPESRDNVTMTLSNLDFVDRKLSKFQVEVPKNLFRFQFQVF